MTGRDRREAAAGTQAMASDSDLPSPSSSFNTNKPLKTLNYDRPESPKHHRHSLISKSMEESQFCTCGICLSDEGKSIRGEIDSCHHYFCFVCIMEWAKIESKCPMCKRRFSFIRRPPKEGVFLRERCVSVPQRDQIYCRFGNATSGPSDPYAYVRCSVCQGTTDENLLLLCDLCDTASHTYCVGMGNTVPEGDWFCHDCSVLRDEHNNAEIEIYTETVGSSRFECGNAETVTEIVNGCCSQSIIGNSGSNYNNNADHFRIVEEMPQADTDFALFEIVSSIPRPRESLFRFWSSHHVSSRKGVDVLDDLTSLNGRTEEITAGNSTELGARTLQRCRDVQSRIQAIRENWSALQNDSLRFSSILVESGAKRCRYNVNEVSQDRSDQLCPSTSGSGEHLRSQDGSPRDSYDVKKAWKMMKSAKTLLHKSQRASCVCQSSKNPNIKRKASKQTTNMSSSLHNAEKQPGNRSVVSDCRNQIMAMMVEPHEGLQSTYSTGLTKSPVYGKTRTQNDVHNAYEPQLLAKNLYGTSSSVTNRQGGSCSINLSRSVSRTSCSDNGEPDVCKSSRRIDIPEGKGHAESEDRKYDCAKSEIQSLVKLNLKLLSRDRTLEYDAFKKVARLATHIILAACGLEHPKSGICFHPSSTICVHAENIEQLHKSTLIPYSCRECFYSFVKDVVCSVMVGKVDHGTGR